jgi:hypothetical protein
MSKLGIIVAVWVVVWSAPTFSESPQKIVRATEWAMTAGSGGVLHDGITIEFRRGDQLPVTVTAAGDLIETTQQATSYVGVKRDFWIKAEDDKIMISFDGQSFRPFNEALTGHFQAGAGGGGIASAIQIGFAAYLK